MEAPTASMRAKVLRNRKRAGADARCDAWGRLCLSRSGREESGTSFTLRDTRALTRADGRIVVGCAPSLGGPLVPCQARCPIRGFKGEFERRESGPLSVSY